MNEYIHAVMIEHNIRQITNPADMEDAYTTHRGKGTQEAGNHAQTSRNNMGN